MAGKRRRCLAVGADLAALRRGTKRHQVVYQERVGTFASRIGYAAMASLPAVIASKSANVCSMANSA
jgi:hypothetical protein